MYEEEDDDLPLQYRRLTAHLQTGSADFNRRLAAYLTNHVAMRSALDQAINDSYAQQFPNAPNFAHNQFSPFPSPIVTQGLPMAPPGSVPQSAPPVSTSHPHPYRQTPYPMPGAAGYRPSQQSPQQQHKRSASIASPYPTPGAPQSYASSPAEAPKSQLGVRRMSMPAAAASMPSTPLAPSQDEVAISSSKSSPSGKVASPAAEGTGHSQQSMGPPSTQSWPDKASKPGLSPLTMTLPQDSQMLLGSTLNTEDPFTSALMAGSAYQNPGYFDSTSYNPSKDMSFYPSLEGMNATLAPSALNMSPSAHNPGDPNSNEFSSLTNMSDDMRLQLGDIKGVEFSGHNASGINTPGVDNSWDAFINDQSSWPENST